MRAAKKLYALQPRRGFHNASYSCIERYASGDAATNLCAHTSPARLINEPRANVQSCARVRELRGFAYRRVAVTREIFIADESLLLHYAPTPFA